MPTLTLLNELVGRVINVDGVNKYVYVYFTYRKWPINRPVRLFKF